MHDIPEEAVKTGERLPEAEKEITRYQQERERWINYTTDLQRIIEALCDRRGLPEPISTARHHYDMAREYLSSRAGNAARILSALEPSAARELALEEVTLERSIEQWRNMKPSEVMKGSTAQITYALEDARKDILSLVRALSSPDHIADAGKVEGDGLPQDIINLVIAAREVWEEADTLSYYHSDEEFSQRVKALDKALEPFGERVPYDNEPDALPSAPASEGAE